MKYLFILCFTLLAFPSFSQFVHRSTLIGTGGIGAAVNNPYFQGTSVAISADGNVAVVGSPADSLGRGAAWVYIRNGNQWVQAGKKLTSPNLSNDAQLGFSAAISADGSTIALGANYDNTRIGAAVIFVRNGNTWNQQGPKLVGTQFLGNSGQGNSIALSADGNTLLVGGFTDSGGAGAAWVFVRSGSTWSQQGAKLISNYILAAGFGVGVDLTADGNTAIIGAQLEEAGTGYVFKRTGTTWTRVQKLTDPAIIGPSNLGSGVEISAKGNVILLGSQGYSTNKGGLWVFRLDPVSQLWVQEHVFNAALYGTNTLFGIEISISNAGDTIAVGGYNDLSQVGAVWTFTYSNGTWVQLGPKLVSPVSGGSKPYFGRSVSLSGDGKILLIGRPGGGARGAAFIFSDPSVLSTKQELNQEFNLYPNPVKDKLYLPANTAFKQITISDLSGRAVFKQADFLKRQIDLSLLPAGIYIVSLHQMDKMQHWRVVKE